MSDFIEALQQIAKEKDIPLDTLIETVESALATAYKRNNPTNGEIKVRIDSNRSAQNPFKVYSERLVVEIVENPHEQISLEDARRKSPDILVGETYTEDVPQGSFGRIAAQTAKQVVVQRIREAERRKIFDEYNERVGEVVTGTVQRREGRTVIIGLGKLDAVLPTQEQVESEPYRFNDRIKVYVLEVKDTPKGPQVIVSRTHPSLIRRLFELEVPEIADGIVTIKSVAREPGARSKIAVMSRDDKVDPVGACVGHRGSRVQAVVNELYDEKIDIVRWNADTSNFIGEALSPAKAVKVTTNEETKSAFVIVPDNQLSLAIGKAGQNVRLAARLTGWRIDIRSEAQVARAALMAMTDQMQEMEEEEEAGPVTIGDIPVATSQDEEDIVIGAPHEVRGNGHLPSEEEPGEEPETSAGHEHRPVPEGEEA
ncbi:MAG TPA: transcription termination factor NusA [Chthonomonadaceae bacterium]|nr:transcription termination factor NusA [Chthonomonadaceae bacterium]